MRAALLADLVALPGIEVCATADPALDLPTPPGVRLVPPVAGAGRAFGLLVEHVDAVWLIAPEIGGVLARLATAVERAGRRLIGPGATTIRRVSDKAWLGRHLTARGIPVPRSTLLAARLRGSAASIGRIDQEPGTRHYARAIEFPVVVKPARGAGCSGVALARDPAELKTALSCAREVAGRGPVLIQPYIAGVAASVSLVSDGSRAVPIAVNVQHVRPDLPFTYDGGETPAQHPMAARAIERALAVCHALPGLVAYIGVDVVLTRDDAVVIEVNPRLTTAYIGLRHSLDTNPATLALAACSGDLPTAAPAVVRRVRFSAGGRVECFDATLAHI